MKNKASGAFLVISLLAAVLLAGSKSPVTDDVLHDRVMQKLATDQIVKGGGLTVDVKSGVVTLSGKVEHTKQKEKAEKLTRKIDGVKSVENQLQVVHP